MPPNWDRWIGDLEPFDSWRDDDEASKERWATQQRMLGVHESGEVWMVMRPALGWPSFVSLNPPQVRHSEGQATWQLEVAGVKFAGPSPDSDAPKTEDQVERHKLDVPAVFGERVSAAWLAVVRRSRYPRPLWALDDAGERIEVGQQGTDGCEYAFGAAGRFEAYRGRVHTPEIGLALGLTQLGERLIALAQAAPAEQLALVRGCLEAAASLQLQAEGAPW